MSGFSPDWLALREPADHRARNRDLLTRLAERLRERASISVVDLGCGAGSNLRALAPSLSMDQHWRLVDHDPALLAVARERIAAWSDHAETVAGDLVATKNGRRLTVSFAEADLARDLDRVLHGEPDLVTAAALFDLVSADWIGGFSDRVTAQGAAFHTALTYNGEESWAPPHPADSAMLAAFHAHQGGDKGFGPSAGPAASRRLAEAFTRDGYEVRLGESPWQLGDGDAALVRELALGIAAAVAETGCVPEATIAAWRDARLSGASCRVGHTDVLALPR